ncbi:MAG: P63C domain-containing protein, partial [Phaeovulum sp.]|uniref:P63C domain-containing protein n=1 Tax=Phaeovulum sp. TaxID=2934796 RepID=UPI002733F23A
LGGKARANALSEVERSDIARTAAHAKWEKQRSEAPLPRATHRGSIEIGGAIIPCAVLEDGRRVLTETGVTSALGSRSGGSKRIKKELEATGAQVPVFLAPNNIKPFITNELLEGPLKPITYKDGRRHVVGFDATILPKVCNVWLAARDAGALQKQQLDRAYRAELLVRALADVAIIALVDEATGFQSERDRDALSHLLAIYLSEERLAWARRFPDEFYRQVYRLRGWSWPVGKAKTQYLGRITNDIVYERLPAGVLEKLRERNPVEADTKRRKWKHHQFLSVEVGQPDLRDHILQILPIMRISKDWSTFKRHLDVAFPIKGTQIEMNYDQE